MTGLKTTLFISLLFLFTKSNAQGNFPQSWEGNWKGELSWYQGAIAAPKKVAMELRIHPTDSSHIWSWQIIYGAGSEDNRPYFLITRDTIRGHWVIDEKNGIVLDQFLIAGRLSGAFTVQTSTIINSYRLENDQLIAEFYSISAKPIATTGRGNEESPLVDSYKMDSYQKAILKRIR